MGRGKGEGGGKPRTLKDASRTCRRRAPQRRGRGAPATHRHTHRGWPWARGNMQPLEASVGESPPEPADGGLQTGARRHLHVTLTGFQAEAGAWPYSLWSSDAEEGKASLPSQDRPPEPPTQPSPALAWL